MKKDRHPEKLFTLTYYAKRLHFKSEDDDDQPACSCKLPVNLKSAAFAASVHL